MKPSAGIHWPSVGLFALSALGLLGLLASLVSLPLIAILGVSGGSLDTATAYPLVCLAWAAGLMLLLLLPGMLFSIFRLLGRPLPDWKLPSSQKVAWVALAAWPVFILLGWLVSRNDRLSLYVLPVIQMAVIAIPLGWLIAMGSHGLQGGSPLRRWGLVNFGMVASQPFILFAETILLVGIVFIWIIWLASNPDMVSQMERIAQRLMNANMNQEVVGRILRPYLQQPGLILAVLGITAGLVPLLEELLKPLGLWMVAGRMLTPQEGFYAGMISGAVFGLIESLGALASPAGSDWITGAIGRVGTGVLHITTCALVGWGMATAFTQGRYYKMVLAYIGAAFIHATWNLFGISMGIAELFKAGTMTGLVTVLAFLGKIGPYVLAALVAGMLVLLFTFNRRLRLTQPILETEVQTNGMD